MAEKLEISSEDAALIERGKEVKADIRRNQRRDDWLAARSFCGRANCDCAIDSPTPCEEFMFAENPHGRCGRCGWTRSEHTKKRRKELAHVE